MDNTVLNEIKERLIKENDRCRRFELETANARANGYARGVEDTLVALSSAALPEQQPTPRTNLDRIRAMSAEEIANWVEVNLECYSCPISDSRGRSCGTKCVATFIKWLNSPVKEDAE